MTAATHEAGGEAARADAGRQGGDDEPLGPAPGLLGRSAEPPPLPPPVHDAEEVTSLHERWANLTGVEGDEPSPAASGAAGGVRAKVRARMASAAAVAASQDRAQDRELIGALVRAMDTLAVRIDEVAARLGDLELLVQELADRTSEDLVRVHLAASRATAGAAGGSGPPARTVGGGR